MELAVPGALRTTRRLLVAAQSSRLTRHARGTTPARFGSISSHGRRFARAAARGLRVAPGESRLVEIALASPVVAVRGDRIVVRRPSPAATIGGGRFSIPGGRRKRRGDLPSRLAPSRRRRALRSWPGCGVRRTRPHRPRRRAPGPAVPPSPGSKRAETSPDRAEPGGIPLRSRLAGTRFLLPDTLARSATAHAKRSPATSPSARSSSDWTKPAATRLLLPPAARALAELYFDRLAAAGDIDLTAGDVRFPGRVLEPPVELSPLARAIVERYETAGLAPPSPGEVARALDAKPQIVEGLVQHLVKRKELVRLPSGLIFAALARSRSSAPRGWSRFSIVDFKIASASRASGRSRCSSISTTSE